jgi:hypothetical protein
VSLAAGVVHDGLPGVRPSLTGGVVELYFHLLPLAIANLAWGACLVVVLGLGVFVSPLTLLLLPVLGVPGAALQRLADLAACGGWVDLEEFASAIRQLAVPAVATAFGTSVAAVVLVSDMALGVHAGGAAGWAMAALAAWGLAAVAVWSLVFWPLLADPRRVSSPVRARAGLALRVAFARPGRTLALAGALALVATIATVLFAAIVSVGAAYVAVAAARFALPLADRLEAPLADRLEAPRV